jgi:hypothetical protein
MHRPVEMEVGREPGSAASADAATPKSAATAYAEAAKEVFGGRAKAHALWVLLSKESDRDGYALRPMPWEGSGEYQHFSFADGRDGFVKVPDGNWSLRRAVSKWMADRAKAVSA